MPGRLQYRHAVCPSVRCGRRRRRLWSCKVSFTYDDDGRRNRIAKDNDDDEVKEGRGVGIIDAAAFYRVTALPPSLTSRSVGSRQIAAEIKNARKTAVIARGTRKPSRSVVPQCSLYLVL